MSKALHVFACVGMLALTACGGGGGGSSAGVASNATSANLPTLTFSASPSRVESGQSATLTWSSDNATSCTASGGWSGAKASSGSETVGPLSASTTFALSCSGPGGGTLREVSIAVTTDDGASVNLAASQPAVLVNGQVELTWSSSNVDACTASGAWSGARDTAGAYTTEPLTEDATFKLTCSGTGTSAVAIVTVVVSDKTIRWQAPTENVDGTALVDLAGFNVYWGDRSRAYTSSVSLDAAAREWEADLPSGEYYFAVTAIDAEANESAYSNEVRKLIP